MSLTLLEAAKAKLEGKEVEYSEGDMWYPWGGYLWKSSWVDVRIAPNQKKMVKIAAWFDGTSFVYIEKSYQMGSKWKRVPSEDKEIEVEND